MKTKSLQQGVFRVGHPSHSSVNPAREALTSASLNWASAYIVVWARKNVLFEIGMSSNSLTGQFTPFNVTVLQLKTSSKNITDSKD